MFSRVCESAVLQKLGCPEQAEPRVVIVVHVRSIAVQDLGIRLQLVA